MVGRFVSQLVVVAVFVWLVALPVAVASPGGNSAATITASFGDSCRDFAAHSSKDISHVEIHLAGGRVVKDESMSSEDYAIDGGAGDEIQFAIVKSGTTSQQFDCVQSNGSPVALLEIKTPENWCMDFFEGGVVCEQSILRTAWTSASEITDNGNDSSLLTWGCGAFSHPSQCSFTFSLRGTGSSDPDSDITSWSLDFGDGTSASGNWSTAPPAEVAHDYSLPACNGVCVITLTVTDSAGQSDSDTLRMVFLDQSPD